jgi:ribonuclease III
LPDDLARQVVTHASWVDRRGESWERLAFLGDVVLSLAVSSDIYPRFPRFGAGRLTKLRAQAVSRHACADVARELGLPERVLAAAPADRDAAGLVASDRILASVCEAVIGAAYLAFGFERVAPAVVAAFSSQVEDALSRPVDFKSVLQERLAQRGEVVSYRIESELGPPHERSFVAVAEVTGEILGRGEGKTKKAAEQEAALEALGGPDRIHGDERVLLEAAAAPGSGHGMERAGG